MMTEKPVEGCRWKTVVCTDREALEYFLAKGLTYEGITEGDILALVLLLNREIKAAVRSGETSVDSLYLSRKIDMQRKPNGRLISCYLYVNSHYFTQREAIRFYPGGLIDFAGWADQGNKNPILRAFLKWCDHLTEDTKIIK